MQAPLRIPHLNAFPVTHWRDYLQLCKPKVVTLIVFTAVVGMALATPGWVPWQPLVFGTLGIGAAAACGAAINHLIEEQRDAKMWRTQNRPLPTGRLDRRQAGLFATVLGITAMVVLWAWVNPLTAVLTAAALIGYAVIYTAFLKRTTPQNIVWGGAAGAAPPLLGWVAVTGEVHAHALLLFLIVFVWTPPHFWPLAIHRRDDYAKADLPMLPVTHGVAYTKLQILLYTCALVAVTLLPFVAHMSGYLYLAGALVLGYGFLRHAVLLYRSDDPAVTKATTAKRGEKGGPAMAMFRYSIAYLGMLFGFLLVDHYLVLAVG